MSKRLQVVLPDEEMQTIQRLAQAENLSVGEFVRRALREAESARPGKSAAAKLDAVRKAVEHGFPTADIDEMNRQISQGYQS